MRAQHTAAKETGGRSAQGAQRTERALQPSVPAAAIPCRSSRSRHAPRGRRRPCCAAPRSASSIALRATSLSDSAAALRNLLHDVAVAVARGEIHLAVDAAGILTQDLLDNAHASRRTRASPSRPASAGCRCCCSSRPGRRPAAGSPTAPSARWSGRTRTVAARSR